MSTQATETMQQLSGDWSNAGMMNQLNLLSTSLDKLTPIYNKHFLIDCGGIESIDMSGLQLLYLWLGCIKIRGLEAKLFNLPDTVRQSIQHLGVSHCFMET